MFVPISSRGRRGGNRNAQIAATVLGGVAAVLGTGISSARRRQWHVSEPWMMFAGIILGLAIFLLVRRLQTSERSEERVSERTESMSAFDATTEDRRPWLVVLIAIVASLLAVGLFLALSPRAAASQEPALQSAFVLTKGTDTLVVERLTRGRSSVSGDLVIKGQARMTFIAELTPGPSVPMLSFKAWGSGASIDSPPLQSGTQRLTADSAYIVVNIGGAERKMSRAISKNPLPIMNNDFAMIELAIARAKAKGGARDTVPMFALTGGVQLDCTIEFVGRDTAVFRIAGQENRFGIDAAGRIMGGTLPAQNIVITRVDGPAVDKISIGRPDYGAPAGAPYSAEEVTVKTPMGHVLTGTLTIPKNAKGKVPAVVTITGSGQEDRDEYISLVPGYRIFRQVADTLGRRGIAVLRMDDRAINGSGGDVNKATSADFADDIRAGVSYLRTRGEIDGARIALVGHSEGGMIAPLVASTDAKVAAIVLMAGPAFTGQRIIDFQLKNGIMGAESIPAASKDSALRVTKAQFDSTSGKVPWMKYFLTYDPVPTAKKVKTPVFIMQGGTDQQVTPDQAPVLEAAFKAGGNKDVTMRVFKDRNHLFLNDPSGFPGGYVKLTNGKIDGEVMGALADWLGVRLRP
jgi:dienelactone hydrolase